MFLNFHLYDDNGTEIGITDPNDPHLPLPDEVTRMRIEGQFDSNLSICVLLTTMLENSPRKLEKICLDGLHSADESPAFLGFLVLIYNKTKSLDLQSFRLSTNATSCLMASLYTQDGISELRFLSSQMPTNQAKILLEGVASSPCLEILKIHVDDFDTTHDMSSHLIQALRRNKSLKEISLDTVSFADDDFQRIVGATIWRPNVKEVEIMDDERDLPVEVLRIVLCRPNCSIEKLRLNGISFSAGHG